jgi:hypothetical protein
MRDHYQLVVEHYIPSPDYVVDSPLRQNQQKDPVPLHSYISFPRLTRILSISFISIIFQKLTPFDLKHPTSVSMLLSKHNGTIRN